MSLTFDTAQTAPFSTLLCHCHWHHVLGNLCCHAIAALQVYPSQMEKAQPGFGQQSERWRPCLCSPWCGLRSSQCCVFQTEPSLP